MTSAVLCTVLMGHILGRAGITNDYQAETCFFSSTLALSLSCT